MWQFLRSPDFAALILRLMLASIFIAQGSLKLLHFDGGASWYGGGDPLPAGLQVAVAWGELACGAALALGLLTRLAALGIIAIMIGAIYKVTWKLDFASVSAIGAEDTRGFMVHEVGYEYNYAIIAMCAALIVMGAGCVSIDRLLFPPKKP
ncbi:MAG: DoxX family protein [Gemmataceae bacterium]|nr:DoxX family protein [Gemmataceae bacterium]